MTSFVATNDANGSFTVPAGAIDNSQTSLSLIGYGAFDYGQSVVQNTVSQLCNFAGPNSPSNPLIGQLWYDSASGYLTCYTSGKTWVPFVTTEMANDTYALISDAAKLEAEIDALKNNSSILTLTTGMGGAGSIPIVDSSGAGYTFTTFPQLAYQPIVTVNTTSALTAAEINSIINITASGVVITLPAASACGVGKSFTFSLLLTSGTATIQTVSGDSFLYGRGLSGSSYVINYGENVVFTSDGVSTWTSSSQSKTTCVTMATGDSSLSLANTEFVTTSVNNAVNSVLNSITSHSLTPGAYLSGNAYNGTANQTWGIQASVVNSGNYLVARDASGNIWATSLTAAEVTASGTISAATISTSGNFTCGGAIYATGDIFGLQSDERIKHDIKTIDNALSLTKKLRGVRYKRKDIDGHKGNIGFVAQEIQKVIPEVVHEGDDGLLKVAYHNVVGLLTEAIKELAAEVDALKAEIRSLRGDAK